MITFPYAVKTTDENLITGFSLDGAGVLMTIAPTLQSSVITNEGRAFRLAEFEYAHTDPVFNGYWKNGEDYFSPPFECCQRWVVYQPRTYCKIR